MDYNNLSLSTIYIGQELSLIAPHSQKVSTYTVKSGDTLYLIANQYQTTVTALKNSNHLTSDYILVGKILKIPNGSNKTPVTSAKKQVPTVLNRVIHYGKSPQIMDYPWLN